MKSKFWTVVNWVFLVVTVGLLIFMAAQKEWPATTAMALLVAAVALDFVPPGPYGRRRFWDVSFLLSMVSTLILLLDMRGVLP